MFSLFLNRKMKYLTDNNLLYTVWVLCTEGCEGMSTPYSDCPMLLKLNVDISSGLMPTFIELHLLTRTV